MPTTNTNCHSYFRHDVANRFAQRFHKRRPLENHRVFQQNRPEAEIQVLPNSRHLNDGGSAIADVCEDAGISQQYVAPRTLGNFEYWMSAVAPGGCNKSTLIERSPSPAAAVQRLNPPAYAGFCSGDQGCAEFCRLRRISPLTFVILRASASIRRNGESTISTNSTGVALALYLASDL